MPHKKNKIIIQIFVDERHRQKLTNNLCWLLVSTAPQNRPPQEIKIIPHQQFRRIRRIIV
ncbi:hypothetical protein HanIR_Chr11g0518631 [Helianthus annuus]|nr:hypothetical protein HanIR_Chr11g0518631 [Helianthus annuus]